MIDLLEPSSLVKAEIMKILKIAIIPVLFILLLSEYCIAQKAEDHFNKGMGYLETNLIENAIEEFKKALPLFEEDQSEMKAEAYAALGNAYNWKGIYKAAITACKKAIEINPALAQAHYNLGFAYREERNRELAKREFELYDKYLKQEGEYIETSEETTPEGINKHIILGDSYYAAGKYDEAIEEYKKALEIEPNDDILNKLGQVYQEKRLSSRPKDEHDEELDTLTTLELPIETDSPTKENALERTTKPKKKMKNVQDATKDDYLTKGREFYNRGMLDEAIKEFKEALEIDPDDVEAHYDLGNACFDKGMLDEAISEFKKVVDTDPEFINAYLDLGMAYLDMGSIDEAISLYEKALKSNPNSAELAHNLGKAYSDKNQYNKAINNFNKAISLNPMDPETQYHLAEMYYKTNQFDLALKHALCAQELGYPIDQGIIDNLKKQIR